MNLTLSFKFSVYKNRFGKWCLYCPVHFSIEETDSQPHAIDLIPLHLKFFHRDVGYVALPGYQTPDYPPPVGEVERIPRRYERGKKNLQKDHNNRASGIP